MQQFLIPDFSKIMASLPSPIDPPTLHHHILQQMKTFEVRWLHNMVREGGISCFI